jgi:hypothetical protein
VTEVQKKPDDDEELDPLPPMDGESEAEDEHDDESLDDVNDDGNSPLDDSTGEDDPIDDEDFGEEESSAIGDDDDGPKEVADEIAHFDGDAAPFAEGDDAPGISDEFDVDEDTPDVSTKDGGEEGLDEEGEELRAEDLPPLDADDEAEQADEGFFDRLADAGDGLAWDPHPWELVFAQPIEGITALAASDGGAYVFSSGLSWVNDRGASRPLAARGLVGTVVELVASAGRLDAVMDDGRVLRSTDDGATFAASDDIRSPRAVPAGAPVSRFEQEQGRSTVVAAGRIVADVSNDSDSDGEEGRIVAIDRRSDFAWVATRTTLLLYRVVAAELAVPPMA